MTSLSKRAVAAAVLSGFHESHDGAVKFPADATTVLTRRRWFTVAGVFICFKNSSYVEIPRECRLETLASIGDDFEAVVEVMFRRRRGRGLTGTEAMRNGPLRWRIKIRPLKSGIFDQNILAKAKNTDSLCFLSQ
jgi:hypothetical protein